METSKYCEEFQIFRKISADFFCQTVGSVEVMSVHCQLLLCFVLVSSYLMLYSVALSLHASHVVRAASLMATDWVRTVSVFIGRYSWRRGSCI
jgi:hypothetical protein